MRGKWWAPAGLAAVALVIAACGSSSSSSTPAAPSSTAASSSAQPAAASSQVKMATVGGAKVLTNSSGFTLYWFALDTPTKSNCNGSCASVWPPLKGPVTAASGVTGKLGTITRADGTVQATYNGHPRYTSTGDSAPGQNHGNGLNASGGVWHEVTVSGSAPGASPSASSGGGGGYGY